MGILPDNEHYISPNNVVRNDVKDVTHFYVIEIPDGKGNTWTQHVMFQDGPLKDPNHKPGIHHEDLIAIVIDRLEQFQEGPYACRENQHALQHLRLAMEFLGFRTKERQKRGVEGTNKA